MKKVQNRYINNSGVYDQFLEILTGYHSQMISTEDVITRITSLFQSHQDLVLEFNQFFPAGFEIKFDDPSFDGHEAKKKKLRQLRSQSPAFDTYDNEINVGDSFQAIIPDLLPEFANDSLIGVKLDPNFYPVAQSCKTKKIHTPALRLRDLVHGPSINLRSSNEATVFVDATVAADREKRRMKPKTVFQ
jgi:hypothetical protein